jgi:uncharacterized protein YhbP (UPF0306 family)
MSGDTKDIKTTTDVNITMGELKEVINDTLRDGLVVNVATSQNDNPWSCSLLYCYDDDFNIYWLTRETTRHSQDIAVNPRVAANIIAVQENGLARQLQIEGESRICSDTEWAMKVEAKYHERHLQFKHLEPAELQEEVARFALYKLTPKVILVTHEALWGHARIEYRP